MVVRGGYDSDNDVFDITTVQLFGMPNEAFLAKYTENKNEKGEDEDKRKGDDDESVKNSGGGAKRGKKMWRVINMCASKGGKKDKTDSWDDHNFDVGGKEGAEWEKMKGKRMTTKI